MVFSIGILQKQNGNTFKYTPNNNWKNLSDAYFLKLIAYPEQEWSNGNWIGIIRIPEKILNPIREFISKSDLLDFRRLTSLNCEHDYAFTPLVDYIYKSKLHVKDFSVAGLSFNPPGLATTTANFDLISPLDPYIGLHLDSWYQGDTALQRQYSPNRIVCNLGKESRYLLFVNLTMKSIENLIQQIEPDYTFSAGTIVYKFFQAFPNYPVFKLEIRPGEAYIAPTENLFHDSTTLGMKNEDMLFTVRGYFGITGSSKVYISGLT